MNMRLVTFFVLTLPFVDGQGFRSMQYVRDKDRDEQFLTTGFVMPAFSVTSVQCGGECAFQGCKAFAYNDIKNLCQLYRFITDYSKTVPGWKFFAANGLRDTMKTYKPVPLESIPYLNKMHASFNFTCPYGTFVNGFGSLHINRYEDRQFRFTCYPTPGMTSCQWHEESNYRRPFAFVCPPNATIRGIYSTFHKRRQDRKFAFYCCYVTVGLDDCIFSPFVNMMDKPVSYTVPMGRLLTGVGSIHKGRTEDRRFKFRTCKFS